MLTRAGGVRLVASALHCGVCGRRLQGAHRRAVAHLLHCGEARLAPPTEGVVRLAAPTIRMGRETGNVPTKKVRANRQAGPAA